MKDKRSMVMSGAWVALARQSPRIDLKSLVGNLSSEAELESIGVHGLMGHGLSLKQANEVSKEPSQNMSYQWVTACSPVYPSSLLDLPNPPAVLWVSGDISLLGQVGVAVVGSRNCTPYGRSVAGSVAGAIVSSGGVVISGGARGIDKAAHEAAPSKTIIVLGCGIAHSSVRKWRQWERENGGLIVSEFHPEQPPTRWSFPQRNRIIAAMSAGTVVVEAGVRSGATITARNASELNRDVFAVPGRIDAPASQGTNRLIASGAHCLESTGLIVEFLAGRVEDSRRLVAALSRASTVGEISDKLSLSIPVTCQWLSMLESSGAVVRASGGRYLLSTLNL